MNLFNFPLEREALLSRGKLNRNLSMEITAKELADLLGARIEGDPEAKVSKLSRIEEADPSSLSFLGSSKYYHYARSAKAGILLCDETLPCESSNFGAILRVKDPHVAFHTLVEFYSSLESRRKPPLIEKNSHIGENSTYGRNFHLGAFSYVGTGVKIGNDVTIYPGVYIGDGVEIGDDTTIYANVSVYNDCVIGSGCILHSGSVVGSDGFGFNRLEDGTQRKTPQAGNAVIGNNVEIGANTCIDRAVIGSTRIHNGVKLDNLVQIGHNVEIGENTIIVAQVGISGSTKLGRNVLIGGQAGVTQHLNIADGVKIQAQSAVIRDIPEQGAFVAGVPATAVREQYRLFAALKNLPKLMRRVKVLEAKLDVK